MRPQQCDTYRLPWLRKNTSPEPCARLTTHLGVRHPRLRTKGKEHLYCCSVREYRPRPDVEVIKADMYGAPCSLRTRILPPQNKNDLILLCSCCFASTSTRSLRGDRASGVRETRLPPPCVSSSACSRKKRELKRPAVAFQNDNNNIGSLVLGIQMFVAVVGDDWSIYALRELSPYDKREKRIVGEYRR